MAYAYDSRWPTFEVGGKQFALTLQEDDWVSLTVLINNGGIWQSWGGEADARGEIVGVVDDAAIMAKGSLAQFVEWALAEAVRRAKLHANVLPLPDPANRMERLKYALMQLVTVTPGPVLQLDSRRPLP